ncbi:hypothetical protein [Streptomyces huiliensis]|uniref:hypothetical protein n=1 Tax=Streptomyces huiliensis TaxID=2876027 RepID=UPI001CBCB656|nr:hypothetical protein [Streptomyces huiliensis]MBZ4320096.1 hypothetical protein [Streptomyces huiliensis]
MKATMMRRQVLFSALALATGAGVALAAMPGTAQSAPPGAAAVFSGYKDSYKLNTGANGLAEVGRLSLPEGSYTISAKLNLDVPDGGHHQTIRCFLRAGNDFDRLYANHDGTLAHVPMSLNVVHTFTASGNAVLTCGHSYTAGGTDISFVKITAVKASSLSNHRMP